MAIDHDIADYSNTSSMSMDPLYYDDDAIQDLDSPATSGKPVKLALSLAGTLFSQATNYAVIVEGWDNRKYGRVGRAWNEQFTQAERNKLARMYGKLYRWYLVTGVPARVNLQLATIALIKKAAAFFASI